MTPLDRALKEQAVCREYLDSDGPYKEGQWHQLCAWILEEAILRLDFGPAPLAPEQPRLDGVGDSCTRTET